MDDGMATRGTRRSTVRVPSDSAVFTLLLVMILAACGGSRGAESDPAASVIENAASSADSEQGNATVNDGAVDASSGDVEVASEFTMMSLAGDEVSLSSLRGRYVLINFWATWCGPCRDEMPYLQQLSVDYADQVTVLGVNMREDPERIHPFVEEFGLTFPVLLHPTDELIMENHVLGLPVSYVVGPDGEVVYRKIGEISPEEFDAWLDENLTSG